MPQKTFSTTPSASSPSASSDIPACGEAAFFGHPHLHPHGQAPTSLPLRHDWRLEEICTLHNLPLMDLVFEAMSIHRAVFGPGHAVQLCSLLSIKTGGCPEDCAYCSQSIRHAGALPVQKLMPLEEVLEAARKAKKAGATRFCMGAAWREVREGAAFESVLEMVRQIGRLGLEVCATLGMLTASQAQRLKEAGLHAYNHNLDTSAEFYANIVSTRSYEERLQTLGHIRQAGIHVCCGGILGLGESVEDRCKLLQTLANQPQHPESVPVNALLSLPGTPLEGLPPPDAFAMLRFIATARILMPEAKIRMAAGRSNMSMEAQALCMLAGANSLFFCEQLLTAPNSPAEADLALLSKLGATPMVG
ncbi:MAG: biotin synthase BioB [Proteobacteria bacterium]|nr:biotin synthase BioB [Cystobacterineae bacterium]MCL2315400.1 biotin synthase BioB [Pseudomonadota bacterium]